MKRLIPAAIILIFVIVICITAHTCIDRACDQTIVDIERFYKEEMSGKELEKIWRDRKEEMSLFVNHEFLDEVSVYIGQLTLSSEEDDIPELDMAYKNIKTTLSLIKAEQTLALHSFY
ncbi:MAG: DUF4363 family protein [Clostridia bacterium]|nr:DUF4363 family protein [Clostridia bacterium]